MAGIPVVLSDFGIPVTEVTANAPVMTVANNGYGAPIRIVASGGAPFIVEGLEPLPSQLHGVFHVTVPTQTGLTAFETMTGTTAGLISRFGVNTSVDQDPADSLDVLETYAAELPANRDVHWSLPLAWPTVTLAQVAAGAADSFYQSAAEAIKAATPNQYWRPIRIGWEMNHAGYEWSSSGQEADYIGAFRRVSTLLRSLVPHALIEWCVSVTDDDPESSFPGASYVDVISGDVYLVAGDDIGGGESSYDAWLKFKSTVGYTLDDLAAFAASHDKPLAISEWGVDTNDAYDFIRLFSQWMSDNDVLWSCYWDESLVGATDFQDKLSDGSKPKSAAEFVKRFGAPVVTTKSSWRIAANTSWGIPLTGWQDGTWSLVSGAGASVAGNTLTVPAAASGTAQFTVRLTVPNGRTADLTISVQSSNYTVANATASAYLARCGTVDEGFKEAIDTLCAGLSTDGLLTKLDALWLFAARSQADALLNIKGTHGTCTLAGTGVTFTPNRGFHGSKSGYIDTNLAGDRGGNVFAQNAALIGGWSLKDFPCDTPFISQAGENAKLVPRNTSNNMVGFLTDWTDLSAANSDGSGFVAISRTGASARAMRRETTAVANDTEASAYRAAAEFAFFDHFGFPNVHEAAVGFVGSDFTASQMDSLRARLAVFLAAIVPGQELNLINEMGSDLLAWWDASQGVSLSGSVVTTWTDRKNGYAPTQALGASRPTFNANGFGGAPCVVFDGADDYLELASQPFPSEVEIHIVLGQTEVPTGKTRYALAYGVSTNFRALGKSTLHKATLLVGNGTTWPGVTLSGSPDLTSRHYVRGRITATNMALALDGGADGTNAVVPATPTTRVRIGCNSSAANSFYMGPIKHIVVTGALSGPKAAFMEAFCLKERML